MKREGSENSGGRIDPWQQHLSVEYIHGTGWVEVNHRAHESAIDVRQFAQKLFPDDPERREAFIDGFTYGELRRLRLNDIAWLNDVFNRQVEIDELSVPPDTT